VVLPGSSRAPGHSLGEVVELAPLELRQGLEDRLADEAMVPLWVLLDEVAGGDRHRLDLFVELCGARGMEFLLQRHGADVLVVPIWYIALHVALLHLHRPRVQRGRLHDLPPGRLEPRSTAAIPALFGRQRIRVELVPTLGLHDSVVGCLRILLVVPRPRVRLADVPGVHTPDYPVVLVLDLRPQCA